MNSYLASWTQRLITASVLWGCSSNNSYPWIDPSASIGPDVRSPRLPVNTPLRQPTVLRAPVLSQSEPEAPPPISGGGVYLTRNRNFIVVSDADRDRVWVVNAAEFTLRQEIVLSAHDEPGRIAEDGTGIVYVATRRSGQVVAINPESGQIVSRKPVCPEPRGIAYDQGASALRVVCAGGEVVTVPSDGSATSSVMLVQDLRDIVVRTNDIVVSTFRSAQLLFLNRALQLTGTINLDDPRLAVGATGRINSVWRMIASADGSLLVAAQGSRATPFANSPIYYGPPLENTDCLGLVNTVLLRVTVPQARILLMHQSKLLPLPTDIVENNGLQWIVSAANRGDESQLAHDGFAQVGGVRVDRCDVVRAPIAPGYAVTGGAAVGGREVYFSRQPAGVLRTDGANLWFHSASSVEHTGHRLFHGNFNDQVGLACASCHAEGGDDGLTWQFREGSVRTPSLRGRMGGTAPYHWRGEFAQLDSLLTGIFVERMGGPVLSPTHGARLQDWLNALPVYSAATPTVNEGAAIARGETVYRSAQAGCVSCHSGPLFTNNRNADVGTGGSYQVPSLVGLRFRAPYMHNGCAATIDSRLSSMACGGAMHGGFGLTGEQKSDLAAYLLSI